eukprot:TRINITY_DN59135_c0_g1_i1.p1 TRINITY_DN59135_c0_g1~~TRINITY_DN59135_c0_g1_i1.p1  ORF type:complete len:560 (-),score=84.74 TRINITY_DN59135_c0_g1_i1:178-1857(-)
MDFWYGDHDDDADQQLSPLLTVFYVVILFSFTAQVASLLGLTVVAARLCGRCFQSAEKRRLREVQRPVAVVVPCYLPNEAPIIEGTVEHILSKLEHLARMDLYLVYNTPHDMPEEEASLRNLALKPQPAGRRLIVEKVTDSRSKAENLNHIIPKIDADFIAIYDADHHPDPESLAKAIACLEDRAVDCVQGSTYIREGCCLTRTMVNAEFFVTYFVLLPIMEAISGSALFGGANAVWKAKSLQQIRFDDQVLTEDIECSARAIMQHGFTLTFLPESRSGELLPANLMAFWTQRLRWAMGWDQVTLRYAKVFWKNSVLSLRRKVGLYYIFVCRWATQLCAVVIIIFNAGPAVQTLLAEDALDQPRCISQVQVMSFYVYGIFIAFAFCRAAATEAHPRLLLGLLMYFSVAPFYVLFGSALLMTSLMRLAAGRTGKWVVTARSHSRPSPAGPGVVHSVPLLQRTADDADGVSGLLALGILTQGAVFGSLIGAALGWHQETHPLWGWVPFGIGATTVSVVDARSVAVGLVVGLATSSLTLFILQTMRPRRSKDGGPVEDTDAC